MKNIIIIVAIVLLVFWIKSIYPNGGMEDFKPIRTEYLYEETDDSLEADRCSASITGIRFYNTTFHDTGTMRVEWKESTAN